jgi:superfamily II DNA or RNA helicase
MSLTRLGVLVDHKWLVDTVGQEGLRKIKAIFTVVTIGHNNTRKTISSFKILRFKKTKGKDAPNPQVLIPRFGGFMLQKTNLLKNIENKLHLGEPREFKDPQMELTENQTVILNHLVSTVYTTENITMGTSSTILQMDPGYGKTYLALGVINYIKKKTFIIVPNTYLLRQWMEVLIEAFPNNIIGCYYGVKKIDGDIVVAIINSALNYPDYAKCGLIIYDEVHMYCSNKFAIIFSKAQATCCLGITATPTDRIDKFDPVARWALGKVIYSEKLPDWNAADVNFTSEVTRVLYDGHKDYTKILESTAGIVSVPLMVNQLQEDPYRNKLIVAYAIKLYTMGRNVFVFSDRREHLHVLAKVLSEYKVEFEAPELGEPNGKKTYNTKNLEGVTELMGGSTDQDIERAKDTGRIIMTTYQYSGTGVSINKMNSIILATPRKSNMKQILGRIYRLTSDATVVRHVIDLVDNKICLKSQFYTRKKTYINKLQAPIKDVKIKWQCCTDIKNISDTI